MKLLLQILCLILFLNLFKTKEVTYQVHNLTNVSLTEDCIESFSIIPTISKKVFKVDTITLLDIVPSTPKARYNQSDIIEYLTKGKFLERAYNGSKRTSIPTSVLIAQTILESNLARSTLTKKTGNIGNIKCICNGRRSLLHRHEILAKEGNPVCIVGYDKIEKSNDRYAIIPTHWEDWNKRLSLLSRYGVIRRAKNKVIGWYDWCYVLHKSPYATDKHYHLKLRNIIRAYNLNALDNHTNSVITSNDGKYIYWDGTN